MAHIVEFRIEGLAGRNDAVEFKLNRDVNLFFGPNGTGKTSMLRVLNAAMDCSTKDLRSVPFSYARVTIYSMQFDCEIQHELTRPDMEIRSRDESELYPSIEYEYEEEPSELEWKRRLPRKVKDLNRWSHGWLPTTRLYVSRMFSESQRQSVNLSEEALNARFSLAIRNLWTAYSSGILSQVTQAQHEGLANLLKALLGPSKRRKPTAQLDAHVAYERMHAFLARQRSAHLLKSESNFVRRYATDRQLASLANDIDEIEQRIATIIAPRVRLQDLIARMFSGTKELTFSDVSITAKTKDGKAIPLEVLSSGEKQALRIFTEALATGPSSLIIDEPELSLNVDWQKTLVSSLLTVEPQLQIIAATHSPEIMADIPDDKIFRL